VSDNPIEVAVPVPLSRTFSYLPPEGEQPPHPGCRVIVPFGRRTVTGVVIPSRDDPATTPAELKRVSRILDAEPLFDEQWLTMARWISAMYLSPLGEVLATMLPGARRPRELAVALGDEPETAPERLTLSEEQRQAIESIGRPGAQASPGAPGRENWHYLYGITGSGKTEVFLQLAEQTIGEDRAVIYLVPEIALTHQLFEHISRRFGSVAAMLHSGLTASQRLGEWRRIQRGEAKLVVGARSAIFAPVTRLGLVVIDEEHENSYKSGTAPRYHARQVALWRALREGAVCVMGSATPSVEAWHLMQTGRLVRHTLTKRLSGGVPPRIKVLNTRGTSSLISPVLKDALIATRDLGGQSILFLNRRGFAGAFQCRSCGYTTDCPRCSVPMTYHKKQDRMICHYCGHRNVPLRVCPDCGSLDVGYTAFGTERVEEDVRRELPEMRIERLDTDSTQKRGVLRDVLDRFARGDIDILLGTQMVAKGLNFPGVRTVGIITADTGLSLPDFRAAERTFGLIVQVAGRAGRFRTDGEVYVQTVRPEHPAIQRAIRMEVDRFYHEELEVRRALSFPPFARLIRMVLRSTRKEAAAHAAADLAESARRAITAMTAARGGPTTVEVLGPAPAALERLNSSWRYQVLLRGEDQTQVRAVCGSALAALPRSQSVYCEVDVDPVNLL
jgi:primosomal protein N' (replication factor Y) (superfamily II helicase)